MMISCIRPVVYVRRVLIYQGFPFYGLLADDRILFHPIFLDYFDIELDSDHSYLPHSCNCRTDDES